MACLPPEHPLAAAEAFPIEALGREPFIHTSPDHDTDQDRLLAALRLHPQTRFTTRDGFTTYNMVADRSGRMKTGAAGANCPGGSGFCLPVTPKSRSDVRRGPRPQRCR